jgi:hypothetical protein
MKKPARYPPNDVPESQSINTLLDLLDEEWIKDHFEKRDKKPNIDGFIELIDLADYPTGKLDVQIKTLPKGASKFQCPIELLAYSDVTTSPLLLICVDRQNERAYWTHVHSDMKEAVGKEEQDSFVVRFDGEIDNAKQYILDWIRICKDFQERLQIGGRSILSNMRARSQGFDLHPDWSPQIWEVLLPVEGSKKELKAAIEFASSNSQQEWDKFIRTLKTIVSEKNDGKSSLKQFELSCDHQNVGHLRYGKAVLFYKISGAVVTLEFRVDGKTAWKDGEVLWLMQRKDGSAEEPNWFDLKERTAVGSSEDLTRYCLTHLMTLGNDEAQART